MGMGIALMAVMMMSTYLNIRMTASKSIKRKFGMMKKSNESDLKKHNREKWWMRDNNSIPRHFIKIIIMFPIIALSACIWMLTMFLTILYGAFDSTPTSPPKY